MGILEAAKPIVVIWSRNRRRATTFYRDTLGLTFVYEDKLAAVFSFGGITLRLCADPHFSPHEHAVLAFCAPDVPSTVNALREKGITFKIYPEFPQDELGIFSVPGGTLRVAWFNDSEGNLLSVTNA